jgi:hypothetical protein
MITVLLLSFSQVNTCETFLAQIVSLSAFIIRKENLIYIVTPCTYSSGDTASTSIELISGIVPINILLSDTFSHGQNETQHFGYILMILNFVLAYKELHQDKTTIPVQLLCYCDWKFILAPHFTLIISTLILDYQIPYCNDIQ